MRDFAKKDPEGRLDDAAEYGRHGALTCVHHQTLRWSTKNIAPLGCRRVFFDGPGMECDCPPSALRLVTMATDTEAQ